SDLARGARRGPQVLSGDHSDRRGLLQARAGRSRRRAQALAHGPGDTAALSAGAPGDRRRCAGRSGECWSCGARGRPATRRRGGRRAADHPFYLLIPRRMIRCIDVCKTYRQGGSEITALAGVSLDISAGAFAVIMGPSGSGKSTVLHLIGGLDRPSSGDVLVDGKLIGQMPDDQVTLFRRRKIGFVFQFFNLLPTLTALENIALPLVLDGQPRTEAARRAENLLVKVGLENRRGHLPEQLS